MPQPDAALLFAAGFGTRMRPLTDTLPKPLVRVAGRPLFDHALALVRDAGVGTVVANTHYHAARMAEHLAASNVVESHEATILDTGGGLKAALPLLSGDAVLTLNTDAVWTGPNPVAALLDAWDPNRMDGLMMLIPRESAVGHKGRGDFITDSEGRLTYGPGLVYSGLQIVKTDPFRACTETVFSMHAIWKQMLHDNALFGIAHAGGWCDVGYPEAIPLAETMLSDAHV